MPDTSIERAREEWTLPEFDEAGKLPVYPADPAHSYSMLHDVAGRREDVEKWLGLVNDAIVSVAKRIAALERENAELRKDAERHSSVLNRAMEFLASDKILAELRAERTAREAAEEDLRLFVQEYLNGEEPHWYTVPLGKCKFQTLHEVLADIRRRAGEGDGG